MTALWTRIKPYAWLVGAAALLVLGYLFASSRMRAKALEKQVEALQALRDAKRRRQDRDAEIDADADAARAAIEAERDRKLEELDARDEALPPADHDALDAVDDEVNAYLEG
jgi:uncharacterized membrane protein YccC